MEEETKEEIENKIQEEVEKEIEEEAEMDAESAEDAEHAEPAETQPEAKPSCSTSVPETDEQWEERTKNSPKFFIYLLIGIIIVGILIYSIKFIYNPIPPTPTGGVVATYEHHPTTETRTKYTYNDYKFVKVEDMWHTEIEKGKTVWDVEFYYGPSELESVPISGEFTDLFDLDKMYVTFDPREEGNLKYLALAVGQLDTSLIKSFDKQLVPGCIVNETDACAGIAIVNCENTKDNVVFFLKLADEPKVVIEDNCVTIQGRDWELIKSTEKFLMKAYGVI